MEENNDEYQHIEQYRYNLYQPRAATNSKDGETKSQLDADSSIVKYTEMNRKDMGNGNTGDSNS